MSVATAAASKAKEDVNKQMFQEWKDRRSELSGENTVENTGGGDGSHTHAASGEVVDEAPVAFKSSPAKIANVGYNYKPFEMKAKNNNNSPIEKNFGSPVHRGFNVGGLIGGEPGKPQAKTGVGSGLNYAAVGSSPAKGWFKKIFSKAKDVATGKGVLGTVLNPIGAGVRALKGKGGEETAAGGGVAEAGAEAATTVPPHGDEAHTGGGVQTAGKMPVGGGAEALAGKEVSGSGGMFDFLKGGTAGGGVSGGDVSSSSDKESRKKAAIEALMERGLPSL